MKKKTINLLIKLTFAVIIFLGGYVAYDYYDADTVRIANWNLNVFGEAKSSNPELMQICASIIEDYDIIFVQEIRDKSETAFPKLCAMLENYSCFSSSRAGRSSSKEQYGVIYKNGINLISFKDFNPDAQDRWERPPIKADFEINNYPITIYNIHTKPDDVQKEMNYLEDVVADSGNVILLGDLNADCAYYNNKKETEFDSWNWLINDGGDTTTSASYCAYDRIILNDDAHDEYRAYGVYKNRITENVSDHYLVWVELEI